MKRTSNNVFIKLLKEIWYFIDRWVITPVTKFILFLSDFFKENGKGFEKMITHRQSLVVISLIIALVCFYVVDRKYVSSVDNSAEMLYDKTVNIEYDDELYVVEGAPETVDLTLIGRKWDVYLAKQYPVDEVTLDLTGYKPGTYNVSFKYEQAVSAVNYKVDPSSVNVTIYNKESETRELSYDIIHKDILDSKLNVDSIVLDRDNVIVKGASHQLEKVAIIKALIDMEVLTTSKVGSTTLENVPLVAYDASGNKVDIEIVPAKVQATIKITSPSKEVPIKLIAKGELSGKAIKSLTSSISKVTVYGNEKTLAELEYLPVEVDVEGISENKTYTVNLKKPTGVRELSEKTISVTLEVDEIVSQDFEAIKINIVNLGSGLKAYSLSEEDSAATIIVKGSQELINTLDSSTIKPYVDLKDYGVGEYKVPVFVEGDDTRLQYESRNKTINIKIVKE